MRNLKSKVDTYFDLQGDISSQFLYYGMIAGMALCTLSGLIHTIVTH